MNERQRAALVDPLDGSDVNVLLRRRSITQAGDGCLITTILAVDR